METGLIVLAVAVVLAAAIFAFAPARQREPATDTLPFLDPRLDAMLTKQGQITGQFTATIATQELLARTLGERLEALEKRMGAELQASTKQTGETFTSITERLNVIDNAQRNIADLSTHVVSLKEIFSDKQARGALSQDQMEAIVAEHLSPDQYEFQATLSNNSRPDCVIRIPNVKARIVVDSKFPLEGFKALRNAANEEERKTATAQIRIDMQKHVKDISEKYLILGEVQAPAIMFLPSDSIYAELHANFGELLRRARQMQVVVVSPHVFMLVITTIQGLMRDSKMREQAHSIQIAVGGLLQDVKRLGDRIEKLRDHFDTNNKDIALIETSMRGIDRHAERIAQVELGNSPDALPEG